jgi:hypothetical protein
MKTICKTCEHSIFCPTWGEYKCVLHCNKFITGLVGCDDFKERGKDFEEKPCQCETCSERSNEEDDV